MLELLDSTDMYVQEEAARLLGRWQRTDAVAALERVALVGTHNGRIGAIVALRGMVGPEADTAVAELRSELDESWSVHRRR